METTGKCRKLSLIGWSEGKGGHFMKRIAGVVLGVVLLAALFPSSAALANHQQCTPGKWKFERTDKGMKYSLLKHFRNYNGGDRGAEHTFTSSQSYTRSFKVSVSVTAEAKVPIFASIEATVSGEASKSTTTSYSNSAPLWVPAKHYGHAKYRMGMPWVEGWVFQVRDNCTRYNKKFVHAKAPTNEGWKLWTTKD